MNILQLTRNELNAKMKSLGIKVRIFHSKPEKNYTGTVLLLEKNNKRLRFVKHDKFSYGIARYTANGSHTTVTDMENDIERFF